MCASCGRAGAKSLPRSARAAGGWGRWRSGAAVVGASAGGARGGGGKIQ